MGSRVLSRFLLASAKLLIVDNKLHLVCGVPDEEVLKGPGKFRR